MADEVYLPTRQDVEELQAGLDWIRNFTGDGVTNRRTGATVKFPRQRRTGSAAGVQFQWVTVVTVAADHLIVRGLDVDFDDTTKDFAVAKPYDLQKTWLDGQQRPNQNGDLFSYAYDTSNLQRRTVTKVSDSSTEDQVIVPAYIEAQTVSDVAYVGSRLLVCNGITNGTLTDYTDDDNEVQTIAWQDVNLSGRAWAKED